MDYEIFDCQVNVGRNWFGPESQIEEYLEDAPEGYIAAIAIPTGTHELVRGGMSEISCVWDYQRSLEFYCLQSVEGTVTKKIRNPKDPYLRMNRHVLQKVRMVNSKQDRIRFYFAPKFHPHLDSKGSIEQFLQEPETVGVKIQGISSFASPFDIPCWFTDMMNEYDCPLMVHTDCCRADQQQKNGKSPYMDYIVNLNSSINWAVFGEKTGIRLYLAHGLKLSPYAAEIVNRSDRMLVGIGPDFMLNSEKGYNHLDGDYLSTLFELVDPGKLAFNTDFAWNSFRRTDWNSKDWESHKRVVEVMEQKGLSGRINDVLQRNASMFFRR